MSRPVSLCIAISLSLLRPGTQEILQLRKVPIRVFFFFPSNKGLILASHSGSKEDVSLRTRALKSEVIALLKANRDRVSITS